MNPNRRNLFKRAVAATGAVALSSSAIAQVVTEPLPADIHYAVLRYYVVEQGDVDEETFDSFSDITKVSAKEMWERFQRNEYLRAIERDKARRIREQQWADAAIDGIHTTGASLTFPDQGDGCVIQFSDSAGGWVSVQQLMEDTSLPPFVLAYEAKVYSQYDTTLVDQFLADYEKITA